MAAGVMSFLPPFHHAFPIRDIPSTRHFYVEILGCREGRSADTWIDFDLFGHQISAHVKTELLREPVTNGVDGDAVPVPHFGCILDMERWRNFRDRLVAHGVEFVVGPRIRFQGQVGEQATMFFYDPSGNALEFKAFADQARIFAVD